MIPLHLRTTTIHVTDEQAERLTALGVGSWILGGQALAATEVPDRVARDALEQKSFLVAPETA